MSAVLEKETLAVRIYTLAKKFGFKELKSESLRKKAVSSILLELQREHPKVKLVDISESIKLLL
jgi:hypothetical protein